MHVVTVYLLGLWSGVALALETPTWVRAAVFFTAAAVGWFAAESSRNAQK